MFRLLLALAALFGALAPAHAQEAPPEDGVFTVATREAPPFVIREENGEWSGLAITLWDEVAGELDLEYELVETDLSGMVEGVEEGRFDASVGALTITPEREERVDFSHPYYTTGFGIVTGKSTPTWLVLVRSFFTWGFLSAVLALAALLLAVGFLFWLVERKANDEFDEGAVKGLGDGFWFSAVTMTTVGYGDKAPRTTAGRFVALIWMFAAIIVISTFTGMIASSLTASQVSGVIEGPDDLSGLAAGSIADSASDAWLSEQGIGFRAQDDVVAGLAAVNDGSIDAFVYDRPLLAYLVQQEESADLRLIPGSFGRQDYGIALPEGSELREPLNVALLAYIEGAEWDALLGQTLGSDEGG